MIFTQQYPGARYELLIPIFALIFISACAVGQQWSENYARIDGSRSTDPLLIDGNYNTVGQTQFVNMLGIYNLDAHPPSEVSVKLPEEKKIYRVVIHTTNLQEFKLMARNKEGKWKQIHDQRSNKKKKIDIRFNPPATTDAIKLVVHKTSDDAAQKRKNLKIERENRVAPDGTVRRGQMIYKVLGPLKATAKIAELELYGFAETTIN